MEKAVLPPCPSWQKGRGQLPPCPPVPAPLTTLNDSNSNCKNFYAKNSVKTLKTLFCRTQNKICIPGTVPSPPLLSSMTSKFSEKKLTWARAPKDKKKDRKPFVLGIWITQTRQIWSNANISQKHDTKTNWNVRNLVHSDKSFDIHDLRDCSICMRWTWSVLSRHRGYSVPTFNLR